MEENRIRICPYTKLLEVKENVVVIQTNSGLITIEGINLSISAMDYDELWIKGSYRKVVRSDVL